MALRRRLAAALAAGGTALTFGVAAAAPADAAITTYISVLTPAPSYGTKVLDIANWSTADRGYAHLWDLRRSGEVRNQRWTITQIGTLNGHGVYTLRNVLSGRCLDKSQDVPNANGNAVYQYACHGGTNQQWEFLPVGTSQWGMLRNVAGGRCLDVTGMSFSNGARLQVWDCSGNWNQRWNIF